MDINTKSPASPLAGSHQGIQPEVIPATSHVPLPMQDVNTVFPESPSIATMITGGAAALNATEPQLCERRVKSHVQESPSPRHPTMARGTKRSLQKEIENSGNSSGDAACYSYTPTGLTQVSLNFDDHTAAAPRIEPPCPAPTCDPASIKAGAGNSLNTKRKLSEDGDRDSSNTHKKKSRLALYWTS